MKQQDMDRRLGAFVGQLARKALLPAAMGVTFAIAGCAYGAPMPDGGDRNADDAASDSQPADGAELE